MEVLDLVVDKIDDLKEAVEKVDNDVNKMALDVRRNTDSLDHHIKRTDLNEQRIARLEDLLSVKGFLKMSTAITVGLGSIAGAIFAIYKVIQILP